MKGLTNKQYEILCLMKENQKQTGRLTDFDQLLSGLSWKPSKESAQFSIRAMIAKDLIKKSGLESRRGRNRVCYDFGFNGLTVFDPRKIDDKKAKTFVPGFVELDIQAPEFMNFEVKVL